MIDCVCVLQGALRPVHAQALHVSAAGLLPSPSLAVQFPNVKVSSGRKSLFQSVFYGLMRLKSLYVNTSVDPTELDPN